MMELKMRLEELQMENEYQLRLKDMNYNDKLRQLSDKFMQEVESLKKAQQKMKTEMEKHDHENKENSAEVATKHLKELKDLEQSYSRKLIMEHEKYQDLQLQHQRMQEDYEKHLKSAEERRSHALEEITQLYEAKLQEKTRLLDQCQEDARQKILEFEEIIKQMEEDEEKKIHALQIKYEKNLLSERETNTSLKGRTGIITQKVNVLQRQIDDRCSDVNKMKKERQSLLGLIRSLENDIEDLKRQISGHERTTQDKDSTISSLKKKNQELEKLKFILEFQMNELKNQIEPQQDEITEKKERIQQLEEELVQTDKSNTQLKLTISDLRLKLRTRDKEMRREMERVKDLEMLSERFKSDLHNCVGFIQEPKKLKDNIKMIYARYVPNTEAVQKSGADDDVQQALRFQREHLQKTISRLNMKLASSAEEHEKVYVKLMKENVTLIAEINELRKELRAAKTQTKDFKAQLAVFKKSNKPGSSWEDGSRPEDAR